MKINNNLIIKSFKLGLNASKERQFITVNAASGYFFDILYNELHKTFIETTTDVSIRSYANYLTSISLLGYILYSTGLHNEFIEAKIFKNIVNNKPIDIRQIESELFYSNKLNEYDLKSA